MMHISFHKKDPSEKIKEATLTLLENDGYDAISMRKIAKEADVALGQLTYYYKTKDNLIVSVVKEVLNMFYDEFEAKLNNRDNKIDFATESIESILDSDTKIERIIITTLSQASVNKRIQKVLREFWLKMINLVAKCYQNEIKGITYEEANIKARLFAGAAIENIVEKVLNVDYDTNNEVVLIKDASHKLGGVVNG